ncbi:hypothetical protein ACFQZC_21160 [Streptacidiphilus monticola]
MGGFYREHILEPGKQPLFLLLVGFIASFLFIRFSVRMIRRGVRWWPGNVTPGGLHIHHVVFGMFFLLVGGSARSRRSGRRPGSTSSARSSGSAAAWCSTSSH